MQRLHFNFIGEHMEDVLELALTPLYMEQPPKHQATDKGISTTLDVAGLPLYYNQQLKEIMQEHGCATNIHKDLETMQTIYTIKRMPSKFMSGAIHGGVVA